MSQKIAKIITTLTLSLALTATVFSPFALAQETEATTETEIEIPPMPTAENPTDTRTEAEKLDDEALFTEPTPEKPTSLLPLGDSEKFGLTDIVNQANPTTAEFELVTNIQDPGLRGLVSLIIWIYDFGRYVLGTVVLLFGGIAIYRLVSSNGREEDVTRAKNYFVWTAVGFTIFSLSWPMKDIFLIRGGNFFLQGDRISATASAFSNIAYYVLQFVRYMLGGVAAYFITASGLKLVTFSESDDVVTQQKRVFLWGLIGLILFMVSNELVAAIYGHRTVTGEIEVTPDRYAGYDLITGISEFLLYFIGSIALLGIIIASIIYVTSGENEGARENSKKIIIGSITGIVIAYVSYTLVAEIISAIS